MQSSKHIELLPIIALGVLVASLGSLAAPKICLWIYGISYNDAPFLPRVAVAAIALFTPILALIFLGLILRFILLPVLARRLCEKNKEEK